MCGLQLINTSIQSADYSELDSSCNNALENIWAIPDKI